MFLHHTSIYTSNINQIAVFIVHIDWCELKHPSQIACFGACLPAAVYSLQTVCNEGQRLRLQPMRT